MGKRFAGGGGGVVRAPLPPLGGRGVRKGAPRDRTDVGKYTTSGFQGKLSTLLVHSPMQRLHAEDGVFPKTTTMGNATQGFWITQCYTAIHESPVGVPVCNHLAEVVRSKPGRRIYGENATYPPIWAYSRTLPQGVELLV